jgi:hypothetical protein
MADVEFAKSETWDGFRCAVLFEAHVRSSDEWITCVILSETLRDRFGATSSQKSDLLATFRQNRSRIEPIAARMIQRARLEQDGTILIQKDDV